VLLDRLEQDVLRLALLDARIEVLLLDRRVNGEGVGDLIESLLARLRRSHVRAPAISL